MSFIQEAPTVLANQWADRTWNSAVAQGRSHLSGHTVSQTLQCLLRRAKRHRQ